MSKVVKRTMRYEQLDSIRGLACLMVLVGHTFKMNWVDLPDWYSDTPLYLTYASHEAVILFFVLSGFVLTLPFMRKDHYNVSKKEYIQFIIKRTKRIGKPFFVATTVLFLLLVINFTFFQERSYYSQVTESKWHEVPSVSDILYNFQLILDFNTSEYNPVVWTLLHEFRFALVFPLFLLALKKKRYSVITIIIVMITSLSLNAFNLFEAKGNLSGYTDFIHYTLSFFAGMLLARHLNTLTAWFKSKKTYIPSIIFTIGVVLFYLSNHDIYPYLSSLLPSHMEFLAFRFSDYLLNIACLMLMIGLLFNESIKQVFLFKPLHFIGKISFSIYLYHYTILIFIYKLLHGVTPDILNIFISYVLIFIASVLSYRMVEQSRGFAYLGDKYKRLVVER